jgi:hypothetical protein
MIALQKTIYLRALRINHEQSISYESTLSTWTKLTESEKQELYDALAETPA